MQESPDFDETLRAVTSHLQQTRRELEGLSRAIWQSIDHNHPARLEEGVQFKQRFNDQRKLLEEATERMLALLREQRRPTPAPAPATSMPASAPASAQVKAIPRPAPQGTKDVSTLRADLGSPSLAPNLEQKVPFGFVLAGRTFTSGSAWPLLYEALLQELYGQAPERLGALADEPGTLMLDGRPLFARSPDPLADPLAIAETLFAEARLAPPELITVIKLLIAELDYPVESLKILLKEKGRGTVETLSIAA